PELRSKCATDADRALAPPGTRAPHRPHRLSSDAVVELAAALSHEHARAFRTLKPTGATDEGDASDSGHSVAEPPRNARKLRQRAAAPLSRRSCQSAGHL